MPNTLKKSIVQDAILGKLNTSNSSDSSIQKSLEKNNISFSTDFKYKGNSIPKHWATVFLKDIASFSGGYAFKSSLYTTNGVRVIRISDFDNCGILDKEIKRYPDSDDLKEFVINKNDVLMCMTGGTVGKCCIVKNIKEKMVINQRIAKISFNKILNPDYLYMVLQSTMIQNIISTNITSTNDNISMSLIKSFPIPVPPIEEQNRIVEKISKIIPLIEKYEELEREKSDLDVKLKPQIKASIIKHAAQGKLVEQRMEEGTGAEFLKHIVKLNNLTKPNDELQANITDVPFDIPKTWVWVKFGQIVDYKMGKTPPRGESEWWKNDIHWVSIADMTDYGHISTTKEFISRKALKEKFKGVISKSGTLLMSFKLTVGRVSILDVDAVHNEAIISIYPIVNDDNIMKMYLFYLLPFLTNFGESRDAIKGKTLNNTSIKNLLIPLPPLKEQKRIVNRIEELLPLTNCLI